MKKTFYQRILSLLLLVSILLGPVQIVSAASSTGNGPIVKTKYTVMNQVATINLNIESKHNIAKLIYLKGEVSSVSSKEWSLSGIDITGASSFGVTHSGIYSVYAEDVKGNKSITYVNVDLEFRAVWISYLEFNSKGYLSEEEFRSTIIEMFDNVVAMNMNAVVVQVRPFSDALYASKYFPWSKYASGTQGVAPTFDPMKIMIELAHERGLEFHAWLNPYRITNNTTDVNTLSIDHPARKWLTDNNTANNRNVINYGGKLYYNPASAAVRGLIVKGVKEIVQNYDVDGIHFDDYFYPTLGSNYAKVFDAKEYNEYKANCKENGIKNILSIADWRRDNVNTLIKNVYTVIKKVNPDVVFGVSPAGFYDKLMMNDRYYVDIETWMSNDGYVDYICPQLYWSFTHSTYPYMETLEAWLDLRTSSTVKIYVGIPVYKAGSNEEEEFKKNQYILQEMVECGRDSTIVDGFIFFRYAYFNNKATKKAVNHLINALNNTY